MNGSLTIGVAIPAYRSVENLRRCLQSVHAVAPLLLAHAVVVDDSGDGRVAAALRSEYPQVAWIVHSSNLGFGPSANEAVRASKSDIVVLLNDDVALLSDPSPHLQTAFRPSTTFAVTFRSQRADGAFREGAKRLTWRMGMPKVLHNLRDQLPPVDGAFPSSYAVGGHAAYRREMFAALEGFDALFEPFYWEDVDLCVRAQERGWQTTYCPNCLVMHDQGGAIRASTDVARIREITLRNRLLFAWRHVPRRQRVLLSLTVAYRRAAASLSHDRLFLRAYRAAKQRRQDSRSHTTMHPLASSSEGDHLAKI